MITVHMVSPSWLFHYANTDAGWGALQHHQLLQYTVSSLGHEDRRGFRQRWECLSFQQPSWSYWTWELDLGNFRLCCMLWSREFIPLPLNWDPQEKPPNKTLFFGGGSLNNIHNRCSVSTLQPGFDISQGAKKNIIKFGQHIHLQFPLSFWEEVHRAIIQKWGATEAQQKSKKMIILQQYFLHHISIKATQLHNQALPYINPLPAQR